jgi:lipopolysaccharide biosynthesis glycosyltransferase
MSERSGDDVHRDRLASDEVVLVCGSDDNYAIHMTAMLTSVLANWDSAQPLKIYIFDGGIEVAKKQKIDEVVGGQERVNAEVSWIQPDISHLDDLRVVGHVTKAAFLRLLIPEYVPDKIDKAIYLDCDLIVENSISTLWGEVCLDGVSHAAAQDLSIPYVSDPRGVQLYEERGLSPNAPYFNSGVLVVNLEWWREHEVPKHAFEYIRSRGDAMVFNDQDALNYILAGNWKPLDRRWNVPPKVKSYEAWEDTPFKKTIRDEVSVLQRDPYIIHYIGGDKPWMYGVEIPWQERYFHYLKESGWFSSKWEWKKWRLEKVLEYYRLDLIEKLRQLHIEIKQSLVPIARLLGVARSSRQ